MNRRQWLERVFGATVAATIAPFVDLTDTTPAFWNQSAIKEKLPWKIVFPDGLTYAFNADVVAENVVEEDGEVILRMTIAPHGAITTSQEEPPSDGPKLVSFEDEFGTVLDVEMPHMDLGKPLDIFTDFPEEKDHGGDEFVLGLLKKPAPFKMTVTWEK